MSVRRKAHLVLKSFPLTRIATLGLRFRFEHHLSGMFSFHRSQLRSLRVLFVWLLTFLGSTIFFTSAAESAEKVDPEDRPDYLKRLAEWDVAKVQRPLPPADPAGFREM